MEFRGEKQGPVQLKGQTSREKMMDREGGVEGRQTMGIEIKVIELLTVCLDNSNMRSHTRSEIYGLGLKIEYLNGSNPTSPMECYFAKNALSQKLNSLLPYFNPVYP